MANINICDRCNCRIKWNNRITARRLIFLERRYGRTYDLCESCYNEFVEFMENESEDNNGRFN